MAKGPFSEIYCDNCNEEMRLGGNRVLGCSECRNHRRRVQAAQEREAKGLPKWNDPEGYKKRKAEKNRIKRAEARAAAGLPPYGSGLRDPKCACGAIKEYQRNSYCNACKREHARQLRLERKASNPNFATEERAARQGKLREDAEHRFKVSVRVFTMRAINQGILIKQPCEKCGKVKVDAHHDDYSKPLDVRWLCRKHHLEHHRTIELSEET